MTKFEIFDSPDGERAIRVVAETDEQTDESELQDLLDVLNDQYIITKDLYSSVRTVQHETMFIIEELKNRIVTLEDKNVPVPEWNEKMNEKIDLEELK